MCTFTEKIKMKKYISLSKNNSNLSIRKKWNIKNKKEEGMQPVSKVTFGINKY